MTKIYLDALHHAALKNVVEAWKVLPGGNHSPQVIMAWLNNVMKPAIDEARRVLNDPGPP
jgi:hypothetical protein